MQYEKGIVKLIVKTISDRMYIFPKAERLIASNTAVSLGLASSRLHIFKPPSNENGNFNG